MSDKMDVEGEESAQQIEEKFAGARSNLHQHIFEFELLQSKSSSSPTSSARLADLRSAIIDELKRCSMGPLYESYTSKPSALLGSPDAAVLSDLKAKNAAELKKLDAEILSAREGPHGGEVEAAEAMTKRANYLSQIGDSVGALAAYAEIPSKPLSSGQKIDIAMSQTRIAFWKGDWSAVRTNLKAAKEMNEKGGDWDRRNRLKVYEGAYLITQRDFKGASSLLLDSIATFTATELLSYDRFVFYTVIACIKCLDRPTLKKKVIDSPDVIAVIGNIPHLESLLHSLYECRYRSFFDALTSIYPYLTSDRLLHKHAPFFFREMRLMAYTQFLESYKSVTITGMGKQFGLSPAFIDGELARFISAGRISAKVDAVNGAIETTRPDNKNGQYHVLIKKGDLLLNKVQKLSRVTAL